MGLKPQNVFHRFVTLTQTCGLQGLGRTSYINDHSSGAQTNPPKPTALFSESNLHNTEGKNKTKKQNKKKTFRECYTFQSRLFKG